MKVDQRALEGIGIKIERAKLHLGVLHDEMRAWDLMAQTAFTPAEPRSCCLVVMLQLH
jgi:hypothetical protein